VIVKVILMNWRV